MTSQFTKMFQMDNNVVITDYDIKGQLEFFGQEFPTDILHKT